jgi:aminoglycoside phosphotransferase family enzyme/predicted kinase
MGELQSDLARLSKELRETHISWVFLSEQRALKVKKPVNFGFLDFSDLESRRRACEAELRLNQRLAPDVYQGIVPITRDEKGEHSVAGPGTVVDWAVEMRRLNDDDRLTERLESGRVATSTFDTLARHLARFHARAERGPHIDGFGHIDQIRQNVLENFAQAHASLASWVSERQQREVEAWQLAFLSTHADRFTERVRGGRIRDGHGDLRVEHVYIDAAGQPTIIDCIEFNERFRYADVCSDIAFLSMDLAYHGRTEDKERLLAAYASESDDHDLYGLIDFYESYRAYVRAKVNTFSLAQARASDRARIAEQARRYFLLSLASERPQLQPARLLGLGGWIASGKSSIARELSARLACPVLSSDRIRKSLAGAEPTTALHDAPFNQRYSDEFTERVYAEVFRRAQRVLASGRSVVVDASFRSTAQRAQAQALAARAGVPFLLIECRASPEVCRARLSERAKGPSESDGRSEIFDDFVARYEPVTELPGEQHAVIDSSGSLAESLVELQRIGALV